MKCRFVVGQIVVCIRGYISFSSCCYEYLNRLPIKGDVFTIREIFIDPELHVISLRFEEVKNLNNVEGVEVGYFNEDFSPVTETDISIFTDMLINQKEGVAI